MPPPHPPSSTRCLTTRDPTDIQIAPSSPLPPLSSLFSPASVALQSIAVSILMTLLFDQDEDSAPFQDSAVGRCSRHRRHCQTAKTTHSLPPSFPSHHSPKSLRALTPAHEVHVGEGLHEYEQPRRTWSQDLASPPSSAIFLSWNCQAGLRRTAPPPLALSFPW